MTHRLFVFLVIALCSCSTFSNIAKQTEIGHEESYLTIVNPRASVKALAFGDFHFAINKKEYRALKNSKSPYRNILVYGQAFQPYYEYYILMNPKKIDLTPNTILVKDTLINDSRLVMLISNTAPSKDVLFLRQHLSGL